MSQEFLRIARHYIGQVLNRTKSQHVADILLGLMSTPCRVYHTTDHILNMFVLAKEHDISLTLEENLAILFHDAVYIPGSPNNEELSIKLVDFWLEETEKINLSLVKSLIYWTTPEYLDESIPDWAYNIVDLDLASAIMTFNINKKIEEEYKAGLGFEFRSDIFYKRRKAFLEKINQRKNLFHCLSDLEEKARKKLEEQIKDLDEKLKNV